MHNFRARTITGLSMVLILLWALYANPWFFAILFLLVVILGLWEFYGLVKSDDTHPQKISGTLSGAILYSGIVCLHLIPEAPGWILRSLWVLPLVLLFFPFTFEIFRKQSHPLNNISITVLGMLYIALPPALMNLLNSPDAIRFLGFPALLLAYFLLTWMYDTIAYLFGKQFGKHPFFERISPKKTWEGTLAGAVAAIALSIAFFYLIPDILLIDWIALTLMVLVFGTLGDLVESLFKRSLNLKDSGNILPGHGGILDRFDTLFLSAPFVFLYFFLRNLI